MIYPFAFEPERALESLLYVAAKLPRPTLHSISKMLYFADKRHLDMHGRLLYGDEYVAMEYGPVPSQIYDVLKAVGGTESCRPNLAALVENAKISLSVTGYSIRPLRDGDAMEFSDSDQECLDWALEKYGHCSFDELTELSHAEEAWKQTAKNAPITVEAMTPGARKREALLADLRDPFPGTAE